MAGRSDISKVSAACRSPWNVSDTLAFFATNELPGRACQDIAIVERSATRPNPRAPTLNQPYFRQTKRCRYQLENAIH